MTSGPSDEDESALAHRVARGDERAFSILMRRHKGPLHTFARRHVGDPEAAHEVVQESFVAAWKALDRYDPARPFGAWMRAIVLNKCRDRGRRLLVRRLILGERSIDAPGSPDYADSAPGPEAQSLRTEQLSRLEAAIARLPDQLKEPLILTYLEGYSQQEAASFLGVSVKTIETRAYRARKRLADWLVHP
ncbi:RNA polymerase sigma factor [Caulobacter segnis]|uniref:RNA polymerase, sigma-24 subunit, ECF subfamily n=2 Tax=Caulobacter segnis TaxID=88688 RepID=D5VKF2_CAUST|nr:RNA polymerase sigma factor [Caulobacter segnis]ADG10975.1 RNA polymerase, sigma-24 subunit, ECF subfamily [Caulobacter segnis ATCC 21756]AVQ02670.1 RNA polymerase sigma factor [Caulobacter segnis]